MKLKRSEIERYSRQIVLKKIGAAGQKKLLSSSVLIVGAGGLGSPIALYLTALGIGKIGIIDKDKIDISNLPRQVIFENNDIKKNKASTATKKLKKINPNIELKSFNEELTKTNISKVATNYDLIIDGCDNFKTRFLINDYCLKNKKILISGAISFLKKNSPCLRCFIPKMPRNAEADSCEFDGVISTLCGIVGSIQANEVVKEIVKIGDSLCGYILIIDALKLTFRKVKLNKRSDCSCIEK